MRRLVPIVDAALEALDREPLKWRSVYVAWLELFTESISTRYEESSKGLRRVVEQRDADAVRDGLQAIRCQLGR